MEWSPENRNPSIMNLVLGISFEIGKSVGIGVRCGDWLNKVVESRVRVLDDDGDVMIDVLDEYYSE